jgi:hypothetical protein
VAQAKESMARLQNLYVREFRSLQFKLREQRRHYLAAVKKEKESMSEYFVWLFKSLRILPNDDNETRNREKWRFLNRAAAVMTAICWTCLAIHELQQLREETAAVAQCAMIMRADGTKIHPKQFFSCTLLGLKQGCVLVSIHQQPKASSEEQSSYKKLQALNRYHKLFGVEAVMHKREKDRKAQVIFFCGTF